MPIASRGIALLALGVCGMMACRDPGFETAVRQALLCDECTDGQLEALIRYGDKVVPRLVSEARGPVPAAVDQHRARLNSEWQRIRTRRVLLAGPNLAADSTRMVNSLTDAFRNSYQRRALLLLHQIGTPRARRAIRRILLDDSASGQGLLSAGARTLADSLRRLP